VVAVVRKLSGWDLGNVVSEYKSYAEPKVRECDVKYITDFELADISNLFREADCHIRTRSFLRSILLALLMVGIWVFSGVKIAAPPKQKLLE
jgi:tyrosine-protein phosphatase SIW14